MFLSNYFKLRNDSVRAKYALTATMTKLLEWLSAAVVLFGVWFAVVFRHVRSPLLDEWMGLAVLSPVIFAALFLAYAFAVIVYRVLTFNDCEYAAKELREQIVEAKEDLKNRGYRFQTI